MGCTSSSIRRCRQRRNLMMATIRSLKNVASAHHAYFRSFRQIATSLIVFASGENLYVSDIVPPLYIQYPVSPSSQKAIRVGSSESKKSTELKEDQEAKQVEVRMAVRHRNLAEIATAIGECFVKASDAGEALLDLLQIRPDKKKSKGLFRMIFSKSRSRKLQDIRYQLEATGIKGSQAQKNHCTTLQKLLAFEKKLYQEVKMREKLKVKHEKKFKDLESQEHNYGNESSARLQKAEASMNKLRSLFRFASEAVSNTSSAIIRTRDDELAPQLLDIFNGMLKMWSKVNQLHYTQFLIIQQVGGLVNQSTNEPTTNIHHAATCQLEADVSNWHLTFQQMVKCQRDYMHSLQNWLKLTILNFTDDSSVRLAESLNKWNQVLDQLPDSSVSEAIQRFRNAVHAIHVKQAEEMRTKGRVEKYRKKLERKSKSLRKMEKKYYKTYRRDVDTRARVDFRDFRDYHLDYERQVTDEKREKEMISEKKKEISEWLRKVDDETKRYEKSVFETQKVALNGLKMSLPSVFQAMARFSGLFVEGLESVYRSAGSSQT